MRVTERGREFISGPSPVAAMIRKPANRHAKPTRACRFERPFRARREARKTRNMATVFGCVNAQRRVCPIDLLHVEFVPSSV